VEASHAAQAARAYRPGDVDYCGLFIEMKRRGGKLTQLQAAVIERLAAAGYAVQVCCGFEEALNGSSQCFNSTCFDWCDGATV